MTEKFFSDECHSHAHKLAAATSALENATTELTAARKAHAEMERMGGRAEIVASHKAVSECELVASALEKQKNALAELVANSLCADFHRASRAATLADRDRTQAGREAMRKHLQDAAEALQQARTAFLSAAGGDDETSLLSLNREARALSALLNPVQARQIPTASILQDGRRLLPAGLAKASEALSGLLKT